MDIKDLKGLMEAYSEIYVSLDEAVKGASRHDAEMRKAASAERRAGDKRLPPSAGRTNAAKMERDIKYFDKFTKKNKPSVLGMTHEEVDIFDIVLEFLQVEGCAETLEEAEWIMANKLNMEEIAAIIEAVKGYDTEIRKAYASERRGGERRLPPSRGKSYADKEKQNIAYMDRLTKKTKPSVFGMTH